MHIPPTISGISNGVHKSAGVKCNDTIARCAVPAQGSVFIKPALSAMIVANVVRRMVIGASFKSPQNPWPPPILIVFMRTPPSTLKKWLRTSSLDNILNPCKSSNPIANILS